MSPGCPSSSPNIHSIYFASASLVLTQDINRVRGHDVLGQLVVDAVAVDDQRAAVGLHDGRDVGRGDPTSLGTHHGPRSDVLQRLVAHHPPDLGPGIGRCGGACQRHWVPDTCLRWPSDYHLSGCN